MWYASGDIYEGNWNNGERSGTGTYSFKETGIIYKGGWAMGKYHGEGVLYYPNGDKIKVKFDHGNTIAGSFTVLE